MCEKAASSGLTRRGKILYEVNPSVMGRSFRTRISTGKQTRGGSAYMIASNTGEVIVETFKKLKFDPQQHPAVLVASHGPFTWGKDVADAVHNAGVLEFIAQLASETLKINPKLKPMQSVLLDKHFLRKHGPGAYYGQK